MQTTNVLTKLETEWDGCYRDRLHAFGSLGDWTGQQLLDHLRDAARADQSRSDDIAHELIQLAHHGHRPAETLLLVAMRPKLLRLARHTRALRTLPSNEAHGITAASLWHAIRVSHFERRAQRRGETAGG